MRHNMYLICFYLISVLYVDDGTFYFDEKVVESLEYRGPLATSSAVVVGLTAFASVASEKIDVSWT